MIESYDDVAGHELVAQLKALSKKIDDVSVVVVRGGRGSGRSAVARFVARHASLGGDASVERVLPTENDEKTVAWSDMWRSGAATRGVTDFFRDYSAQRARRAYVYDDVDEYPHLWSKQSVVDLCACATELVNSRALAVLVVGEESRSRTFVATLVAKLGACVVDTQRPTHEEAAVILRKHVSNATDEDVRFALARFPADIGAALNALRFETLERSVITAPDEPSTLTSIKPDRADAMCSKTLAETVSAIKHHRDAAKYASAVHRIGMQWMALERSGGPTFRENFVRDIAPAARLRVAAVLADDRDLQRDAAKTAAVTVSAPSSRIENSTFVIVDAISSGSFGNVLADAKTAPQRLAAVKTLSKSVDLESRAAMTAYARAFCAGKLQRGPTSKKITSERSIR
jgi:hypothetical protein